MMEMMMMMMVSGLVMICDMPRPISFFFFANSTKLV